MLNFCTITHSLSVFGQHDICSENIVCDNTMAIQGLQIGNGSSLEENFKMDVMKTMKFSSENNSDYEEFLCKNEEVDLKIDFDREPETDWYVFI